MRHSEAVAWVEAMWEAVTLGQTVTLQALRRIGADLEHLTEADRFTLLSTPHLFDGKPLPGWAGLGHGLIGPLEVLLNRVKAGGQIEVNEFCNLAWLFAHHPHLSLHLLSVAHQRGSRPPLTVDGVPMYDLPDCNWRFALRDGWAAETRALGED